jgi:hypothetical protein
MSELELIQQTVARTAQRRRWLSAWRGLWSGLFVGASFWLLSLALFKVLPLPEGSLPAAAILALLLLPAGFLAGWFRRLSPANTARWIDSQGGFQERLSTALELARTGKAGSWHNLLLADAARHAARFDPRASLPYRLPHITRWTVLVLLLGVTLEFAPTYRTERHQEKQRETAIMQDTGRRLDEWVRRELDRHPPTLESSRQALDAVQDLAAQLAKAKLTRTDALRELASVSERLHAETAELGRNPALRRLQQAAAALPEAGSAGGETARAELSRALADLARQKEELGLSIPNLDEAIHALDAGQIDQVLRDLNLASIDLEQMAKMAQALQEPQQKLAEIGKDLAEQLEKGQGNPALASLEKMMRQLADPDLSDGELARLLEEIREAVAPGSELGEVGEALAAAAERLQQDDRAQAVQSLARAAEELPRLMEQLGDAQGLMAALEGLQIAQMSVGNTMSWGVCQSELAEFKPGGPPSRGVGTWADDNNWTTTAENSGLWDNTGIERPDFDPRDRTDRGEAPLSEALNPTRVKGQISPGGSMPSITLRGLSLRGESRVGYEEAVAAAQTDAQSALSQERVPRAYQAVVRDYFDDLKD